MPKLSAGPIMWNGRRPLFGKWLRLIPIRNNQPLKMNWTFGLPLENRISNSAGASVRY